MDSNSYSKPPIGRKMKNPAPPPPGPPQPTPRRLPRNIVPDGGVAMSGDIIKENVLQPHVELQLSLPSGAHTTSTYDGRKALMDLLVEVCGQYHLNPAYHTLELLSSEGQPVAFKPNAFLGSLDVACALIKERVVDEKLVRKPVPRVPEKSVRLVVNYHRSQKTVVRVSPLVPLHALVPVICQRCEFDPAHVLLLRDSVSRHELDLDKSLSDLEIRELYALDQSLVLQPKMASAPALNYAESTCSTQSAGTAEKKGLLGFFKFNRRKSKTDSLSSSDMEEVDGDGHVVESAENDHYALSGVSTSLEARPSTLGQSQSVMNISKMSPKVELKKRRAPAPPPNTAQSYSSLGMHAGCPSTSSLLKKRKAPAPPPTPASHSPTPTPTPTPPTRSSPAHVPKATPPPTSSSAQATVAVAAAASAAAVTTATVALPTATASRRVTAVSRQYDTASEASGASEESERNVALCSSSSSQADSDVPSSHLDEVAVSSQDEEYEEEEYEEVEEEEEEEELELEVDEMEMELAVLQQLQQRSRQQMSQPVVVERLQHRQQPALLHTQASEPRPQTQIQPQTPQTQTQTPQPQPTQPQPPQQPQGLKQQEQQQQAEEHLQDSDRSTTSAETGSTVSLRMDDTENNRHSGIDAGRQVPVKPRRTSLGDQTSRAASASPALIDRNSHNASPDSFTDMPQHSWLHSSRPAEGAEVPVDCVETGSVSSSSGSFADQGYAEDPCPLSSPADRTPPRAPRDLSSDSDEGCATWNSSTSQDLYQKGQSGKIKDSYEEDPKLMAQLQLTLADLDAELAEMNQSSESPSEADDVIPVSVVDLVPVTTIDEVSDTQLSNGQNKNNNATLCPEPAVQPRASAEVRGSRSTQEVKQSAAEVKRPAAEVKRPTADSKDKTLKSEPSLRESKAVASATGTKPPPAKSSAVAAPSKAQPVGGSQSNRAPSRAQEVPVERSKITQVPASRFGTKTFTIVPTKVAVPSSLQTQGSLTNGAIKIDERGNMMKGHGVRQCVGTAVAQAEKEEAEPQCEKTTLGAIKIDERGNMVRGHGVRQCVGTAVAQAEKEKAKTLWTSTDKQDAPTATKTTTTTTTKTMLTPQPAPGGAKAKPAISSVVSGINHSSTANGREAPQGQESRPPSSEPAGPAQRATPSAQDPRDLSFLKPQRRTSSQYMASAISNKFTVRSAVRAEGIQEKPEPAPPAQKPSTEARPATTTSSISSVTVKGSSGSSQVVVSKENGSVPGWTALKGPQAYRSHTFNKQSSVEPPRALKGGAATASDVDSVAVNGKTKLTTHVAANRSNATPAQPDQNPEPWAAPGVLPEPNQVSLFGPVKKFRPVIQKSVEKDTSLHSSLMQAIQSGDSKERLKKVCEASAGSGMKKPALQEEESTQSALLSALRADNSNRLKQTKSKAANELERFRATESASASQNQSSSLQHTSPPSAPAAAPPPPPPPAAAPPPPRAVLASAGNPEQTREALLDAIRSGAGAKGLKRVPVATKTVMVNGRLGTMTASCSLSQGP